MSASPAKLPRDLQGRLDIILARPLLRRAPSLQQAIETLVRNAFERQPGFATILTRDQQDLLDQLSADRLPDIISRPPDQDGVL